MPGDRSTLPIGPTRHRWIADPIRQRYVCTVGIPSLYRTYDAICYGCGAELPWADVPGLDRYRGVSEDRLLGEQLGLRLDLRVCEIAVEKARAS